MKKRIVCKVMLCLYIAQLQCNSQKRSWPSKYINYTFGAAAIAALSYFTFIRSYEKDPADTLQEIINNAMHPQQRKILQSMRYLEYFNEGETVSTRLERWDDQPTHRIISKVRYNGATETMTTSVPIFEDNETDAQYQKKVNRALLRDLNRACISMVEREKKRRL